MGAFVEHPKYGRGVRTTPLIVKLDSQTRLFGDFTFPSVISDVMVRRVVGEELLRTGFLGFDLGPVQLQAKPGKVSRNVALEELSGEFAEILIKKIIPLEKTKSIFTTESSMGKTYFKMPGVAHFESDNWNPEIPHLERILIPRETGKGFFIPESALDGCDVMRVSHFEAWSLCTDRFRDFVLKRGYTNVAFLEVGDVVLG